MKPGARRSGDVAVFNASTIEHECSNAPSYERVAMTMTITPYLYFAGECESAMRFYAKALAGEITALLRYEGSPLEAQAGTAYKDRIMHSVLVAGEATLMASDVMPERARPVGTSVSLSLAVSDAAKARQIFDALAIEGHIAMPLEAVFWGGLFGSLTDRFGITWQISSD